MSTRTKKNVTTIINREELPECMRRFSDATSKIKGIEAEIELATQEIRRKYQHKLDALMAVREDNFDKLQVFAEANKRELFVSKKSMELTHGTMGFRLGTPAVEKSKKVTWEGVLENLRLIDSNFVRTKEEANKELIIAGRQDAETMQKLRAIGLDVVQKETFFVEARAEDLVNL